MWISRTYNPLVFGEKDGSGERSVLIQRDTAISSSCLELVSQASTMFPYGWVRRLTPDDHTLDDAQSRVSGENGGRQLGQSATPQGPLGSR
ncbi:MAG TPA: hypothetical protein VGQ08_17130 [Nitrospiraceae bacterium]|nr:hypothetical protein [Nitrospiraceae bacterium]